VRHYNHDSSRVKRNEDVQLKTVLDEYVNLDVWNDGNWRCRWIKESGNFSIQLEEVGNSPQNEHKTLRYVFKQIGTVVAKSLQG